MASKKASIGLRRKAGMGLRRKAGYLKQSRLATLLYKDAKRLEKLTFTLDDLTLDLTKEKLDGEAVKLLLDLAREKQVEKWRDLMAAGEAINTSEIRPVLHMALRGSVAAPEGDDVEGELQRFLDFAEAVRSGAARGKGGRYEDVLHIGIGGSDLGPRMATTALETDAQDGPWMHFVSNLDSTDFCEAAASLNPETTLVIVSSKSFETFETIVNADLANEWLGPLAETQMVAVSACPEACEEWGIPRDRVYRYWNWVGGRYSIWSAVGLPLAIAIGAKNFRELLKGAAAMDRHFLEAPLEENLPVLYAMAGIWRRNYMEWPTVAIVPYDQRLEHFPAYLQQLDMESNGKRKTWMGENVEAATGPIIWGAVGTNAQHSFFQYLHQGTDIVPVDFILAARTRDGVPWCHEQLKANCLAQGMALAVGWSKEEKPSANLLEEAVKRLDEDPVEMAKRFMAAVTAMPGDRPSTTLLHRELNPYTLGRLIALYEHKVFVQGAVWGVNSFDQPGVQLGKSIAHSMMGIKGATQHEIDLSTKALQARLRELEK